VDNGSTDDSVAAVRAAHGDAVQVIALPENTGSAGGFDVGIRAALDGGAEQALLLDSDVVLNRDCLEALDKAMAACPSLGVVGPKIYHLESEHLLQEFGGWIDWDVADLRRSHFRHDESVAGTISNDVDVDFLPACCLLARRDACIAAGSFDPGWFLYWDDIDWCMRVRATGTQIRAVATARVQHFSGRDHKGSLVPVYYGWRNRVAFFLKHTPQERRAATWRALFTDCLRAQFTCESLGLHRISLMMGLACDDALSRRRGPRTFDTHEILPDAAPAEVPGPTLKVEHVLADATEAHAAIHGLVLEDRFGKRLPAAQAWKLRQQCDQRASDRLPGLLARAQSTLGQ